MKVIAKEEILRLNCPGFGEQSFLTVGKAKPLDSYKVVVANPLSILHLFDHAPDILKRIDNAQIDGLASVTLSTDDLPNTLSDEITVRTEELVKFLEDGGLLVYFLCRPFILQGPSNAMDNYVWLLSLSPVKSNDKNLRQMSAAATGRNIELYPESTGSEFAGYFEQSGLEWNTIIRTEFLTEGYTALATAGPNKCIAGELYAGDNGGRIIFLPSPYSPDFDRRLIECINYWYQKKTNPSLTWGEVQRAVTDSLHLGKEPSKPVLSSFPTNSGMPPNSQPGGGIKKMVNTDPDMKAAKVAVNNSPSIGQDPAPVKVSTQSPTNQPLLQTRGQPQLNAPTPTAPAATRPSNATVPLRTNMDPAQPGSLSSVQQKPQPANTAISTPTKAPNGVGAQVSPVNGGASKTEAIKSQSSGAPGTLSSPSAMQAKGPVSASPNNTQNSEARTDKPQDLIKKMEAASSPGPKQWCSTYSLSGLDELRRERAHLSEQLKQIPSRIAAIDARIAGLAHAKDTMLVGGADMITFCQTALSALGWNVRPSSSAKEEFWLGEADKPEALAKVIRSQAQPSRSDLAHLAESIITFWDANEVEPKGLLIACVWADTPIEVRKEPPFGEALVEFAQKKNMCLMSTLQLLTAYKDVQFKKFDGSLVRQQILSTSGALSGFEFEIIRNKPA